MLYSSRSRFALAAAAAAIVAFSMPASAAEIPLRSTAPREQPADANAARGDADRMICVRAQLTGSRLNRRICRTQREWDEDGGVPTGR